MRIPHVLSVNNELPIRISRSELNPDKRDMFNSGKYARSDYRHLYTLVIDKGEGQTFHQLATPSFKQLLWSIPVLWRAKDGDPYDRHNHPVVMQSFDVPKETKEEDRDGQSEASVPTGN